MVIKEFLTLVKIYDLSVGRYNQKIYDLYVESRYGEIQASSFRLPLALGKALLASTDFCRTAAGLADDHGVMLPVGNLLQSEEAVADRLRFMLHAGRNLGVIDSVLASLTRLQNYGDHACDKQIRKKRFGKNARGWLASLDLNGLASRITAFAVLHPVVARSFMRGDLERAAKSARAITADQDRSEAAALIREIALVWGLFDLQIIAARLFHCEHGSYAGGSPDAPHAALTTESVSKMIKILDRAGQAAYNRVFKRDRLSTADEKEQDWLDKFVDDNELRVLAVREGERLGLTRTQLAGLDDVDRDQEKLLYRYLIATAFFGKQVKRAFKAMEKNQRTTLVGEAAVSYPSRPAKGSNGKNVLPKIVSERHLEATLQRYGASTIALLTFAVVSTITTVSRLPKGEALLRHGFKVSQARGDLASRTHEESDVIRQLVWVYRTLIVRDPNHFVHGYQEAEYQRLIDEARNDDFYEPLEPAPGGGNLTRGDWVMGRGLLANQKIEAFESFGSPLCSQQARSPGEGLRDALALVRCLEDNGRNLATVHLPTMALLRRSFTSSLDLRFERTGKRQEWRRTI